MEVMEDKTAASEPEHSTEGAVEEEKTAELKIEEAPAKPCLRTLKEMSSGENMIIDLGSGIIKPRKLTGPELLYQKFLKTQAKPKVNKEKVCMMNILSVENGKLGIQKVEVKLDKEVETDHNRPGFSREVLKQNLRNQIVQKRLEIIKNKGLKCEYEPEETCKANDVAENKENKTVEDESDEDYDPEAEEENSEGESAQEEEEESTSKKQKKKSGSTFIDNEAIDEDDEENEEVEEEEESSESSDDDDEVIHQNGQRKGRILKAFADSDEEELSKTGKDEKADPPATDKDSQNSYKKLVESNSQASDFTFDEPSVSEEMFPPQLGGLLDSQPKDVDDEDLMDICSGQFFAMPTSGDNQNAISQDVLSGKLDDLSSRVSTSPAKDANVETAETQNLECTVEEVDAHVEESKDIKKLLESTDDEADNEADEVAAKDKPRKKKRSKLKTRKLRFSDDESDGEEEEFQHAQELDASECEEEGEEEPAANDAEVLIDYDSEENEIEVKMTKKDKIREAQKYFENEAELSESEWGSADEDEKGMDKYDERLLADDEHFDQAQLREEVGRIHARKVMDEDLKNVKKIQELLFENEENDGVGRERKFRWKNQTEGFSMEDENARDADDVEENDDDSEAMWRKMRHERETLINEQSQKMLESETMSADILLLDQTSQTVTSASTSTLVKRKFQIIRTTSCSLGREINSETTKKESPFLIKADQRKFTNSFLAKGEKTLAKIASFMSNKGGDDEVTNLSSHGGGSSMSFAPIERTVEAKKRKSDGNDGANAQRNDSKKRKVENHRFLLDQLT